LSILSIIGQIQAPAEFSTGGNSGSRRNEDLAPAPAKNEEGRRKYAFDLNELPPNDDDDETDEK
jgi:hypothetical protein